MSEPTEPLWITYEQAIAIHSRQLRRFGGAPGLRDEGMLRSALERPINKWQYEQASLPELAAAYAFGLAKNHAFVDGNKRTGLHAALMFLATNGLELPRDDERLYEAMIAMAERRMSKDDLAALFRELAAPSAEPR